jgi:hypothetical protein
VLLGADVTTQQGHTITLSHYQHEDVTHSPKCTCTHSLPLADHQDSTSLICSMSSGTGHLHQSNLEESGAFGLRLE